MQSNYNDVVVLRFSLNGAPPYGFEDDEGDLSDV